ncbi:MAG: hypothetical protein Q8O67_09790 [Deltaproteobacteria bacterium]|nr:hypothetical protein [Deltaproteobacteria bacterium]
MLVASGCFNPTCIGEVQPRENHVPVVEVQPDPSFNAIPADIGKDCEPITLRIDAMNDADGDTLTVRFDMLLQRRAGTGGARIELAEREPIEPSPDGTYALNSFTNLEINRGLIDAKVGNLSDDPEVADTQLIELRVSDNGFVKDENDVPVVPGDGDGLFFSNWLIRLSEADCTVTP